MIRRLLLAGITLLVGTAFSAGSAATAAVDEAPPAVMGTMMAIEPDRSPVPPLQQALVVLADALGVASAMGPVDLSGVSGRTADVLARLVMATDTCVRLPADADDRGRSRARVDCAARLRATAEAAGSELVGTHDGPVDAWPLLRFSPGVNNDTYVHDYAVLVDLGGNDLYDNNAGGNLLDVDRGPDGSSAPVKAPARGCETATQGVGSLCVIASAVLVDGSGNDTYGVLRAPSEVDSGCTADLLVRRIATAGAAVGGVGVLVDRGGNDGYLGKTLTQGTGHLGGVGVLHDLSGNDKYSAIRSAQGTGVLGGLGVLLDDAGNDTYGFYRPAGGLYELRPPNLHPRDAICDDGVRQLQGAGTLAGTGVLLDRQGNDKHAVDLPAVRLFGLVDHESPSLGGGSLGGAGVFSDLAGRDLYVDASGRPLPSRGDGVTTATGGTPPTGVGLFHDARG